MSMNRWDAFSGWPQIYIPVIEELIVVELKVTWKHGWGYYIEFTM